MKTMSSNLRGVALQPKQLRAMHAKKDKPTVKSFRDIKVPKNKLSDIKVPKGRLSDIPGPGTIADVPRAPRMSEDSNLKKEVGR